MAKRENIFAQDWRDSLEAHYKDVVRRGDKHTESTLIKVMLDVGFTEDELQQLKLYATMRTEDLQGDFIPELEVHDHSHHHEDHTHHEEEVSPKVYAGIDVPDTDDEEETVVEVNASGELDELKKANLDDGEITEESENEEETSEDDSPTDPDPDAPQQMSMF